MEAQTGLGGCIPSAPTQQKVLHAENGGYKL